MVWQGYGLMVVPYADARRGIEAAHATGLTPLKVNMVVKRGTNDIETPQRWRVIRTAAARSVSFQA
ncbi:MAG: GTP 3',8-cyclase (EC [Candidatus Burkholderia crenata]|nr:MAG: GTP 3',8-cyclase (EC [Candidatus Burkholderia crenata]